PPRGAVAKAPPGLAGCRLGSATLAPRRPPLTRGCCGAGAAEVREGDACRAMADAGGPEGRASCRGAGRGAATCGGAAICGAARGAATCGAATCGAARGAAACGPARGAETCGAGAAWGVGAARGAGVPPPPLCGCAAAVVAIAAETIRTAAMWVFHWNITPPPSAAHATQRQTWRAGFACEGAAS